MGGKAAAGSVERRVRVGGPARGRAIARRPAVRERFGGRARRDVVGNGGAVMRRVIGRTSARSAVVTRCGTSGWVMRRRRLGLEIHRARAAEVGLVRETARAAARAGGLAQVRSTGAGARIGRV